MLDSISSHQVTIISAVQTMLSLAETEQCPESLRCILLGGGTAAAPEECRRKQFPVFQSYGLTETCSQIVTLSPEFSMDKLGSTVNRCFHAKLELKRRKPLCAV